MPPVEDTVVTEPPEQQATKKSVVGIIYPPPEVRNIVDKTASFVARNGPEFETRIRQNEINNPKFNFLNGTDPYNAYYQHKVKEFKEGKGQEPVAPKSSLTSLLTKTPTEQAKISEPIVPKEPPPEFEFVADPPSISTFDLDVVKLTAQFVARNGRQFLTNLMNREQRNYQFDFLRPQHSLFNYFTKLVEQYTKILIPPKDLLPKLRKESDTANSVLDLVKYRVEWHKYQERERRKEEEEKERERVAYAQIDWHDFVVVETVDFQPNETGNLPPPTTPEEVGARLLAQERYESAEQIEMEMESGSEEEEGSDEDDDDEEEERPKPPPPRGPGADVTVTDMEEDSDEEGDIRPPPGGHGDKPPPLPPAAPPPPPPKETPQPPPLPPNPEDVIIKTDYNPKAPRLLSSENPDEYIESPITGEMIHKDKFQEHMRIGLLDPKWKEQRDRAMNEKLSNIDVFASGSSVDSTLKKLAERRTDIFGAGIQETTIGKKIGEEEKKKPEKVIWDGHTASMEKVTQKARENISIEEQIAVIHKSKGLLHDSEKEKIGPTAPGKGAPHPPMGQPRPPLPPPPPMSKPLPPPPSEPPKPEPPKSVPSIPAPPRPPVMGGMGQRPAMMMMATPPQMGGMGMRPVMAMPMPPRPPVMPPRPPQAPMPPQYMQQQHRPPIPPAPTPMQAMQSDDGPPSKKAKTEEQLIPENEFAAKNKGPVMFKVAVPKMEDKPEWKLNGQSLPLTLPITDSVAVIKAKLHEALGMPAGKQKLQVDGLFLKDSNTLAYYNISKNVTVHLQVKERGGRKK